MKRINTTRRQSKELRYEQLAQLHLRSMLKKRIEELETRVDELEQK